MVAGAAVPRTGLAALRHFLTKRFQDAVGTETELKKPSVSSLRACRRYNDLVVAGAAVPGSGPAALNRNDSVTKRFQDATDAGLNIVRMFASQGENDLALEPSPGVQVFRPEASQQWFSRRLTISMFDSDSRPGCACDATTAQVSSGVWA